MRWLCILLLSQIVVGCGAELDGYVPFRPLPRVVTPTPAEVETGAVLPGSYIVAFKNDLRDGGLHFASYPSEYQAHYSLLADNFLSSPAIIDINYLTAVDLAKIQEPLWSPAFKTAPSLQLNWDEQSLPVKAASIAQVDFASDEDAKLTLKEWEKAGLIWFAEPNYDNKLFAETFEDYAAVYKNMIGEGDDKTAPWLDQINLVQAFQKLSQQGVAMTERPLIAVMDSGIDYLHPALADNMWKNPSTNQAGCRNDYYGCNTTQSQKGLLGNGDVHPVGTSAAGEACPEGSMTCRHGTHVAGIIAAKPQNDYAGVCPHCQIMSVRIVGKTARGEGSDNSIMDSSIIAGFSYISRFKKSGSSAIKVVNASFGKFQRSRTVEILIRLLRSASGILVVAAAGNEDTMLRQYPAAFADVVAVANVQSDTGIKNRTSNFGRWVQVSAPGGGPCELAFGRPGIRSSVPGNQSYCSEGSSMSSPVVSGVAGLLLTLDPGMSFSSLRSRIINTADPGIYQVKENKNYIPQIRQEQDPVPLLGSGVVSALNAIENNVPVNRPIARDVDRVSNACGMIDGFPERASWYHLMGIWILPLLVVGATRRWVNHQRQSPQEEGRDGQ